LIFSYIGYQTVEIPLDGRQTIEVTMISDQQLLDEVVVVGYGTQKKVNLTGSVAMIEGDDLANRPVTGTMDAMQGAIPGVVIARTSGSPGDEGFRIQLRGLTSVNNNSVLVLVDGVEGNINDVLPEDVESISVLKDAAAASIYGAKAAGGVILITTKRGEEGQIRIEYNAWINNSKLGRLPERLSSYQWVKMRDEAVANAGGSPALSETELEHLQDPNFQYDINPANPNQYRFWGDYDYVDLTTKRFTT